MAFIARITALVLLCAALASCALIKKSEKPRNTYELTAPDDFGAVGSTSAQLLIKVPTALKAIDSDRLIQRDGPAITYMAGVQWSDTVPRMVQAKLVEAFENTGKTGATAKPGDGLVIDYQLISDLRRFEIRDGVATVELSIKLLTDKSGLVRQTRIFKAKSNAQVDGSGDDGEAAAKALNRAFNAMAKDVVRWVFKAV